MKNEFAENIIHENDILEISVYLIVTSKNYHLIASDTTALKSVSQTFI
jgi:hypothetical protein